MPALSLPRWTKPWKVIAIGMAIFGFVNGYVGIAGAPYCGSMGQCLQRVVDAGPPWFYPAALIPAAVAAAIFGAVVYVLFLAVYAIRRLTQRQDASQWVERRPSAPSLSADPRSARLDAEPSTRTRPPGPRDALKGPRSWPGPRPLLIAFVAAVVWGFLSVGPARLAEDANQLIPRDSVTEPGCPTGSSWGGPQCRRPDLSLGSRGGYVYFDKICSPEALFRNSDQRIEADGLCHERSGGTAAPLMSDAKTAAEAGLLAFLAVGAALLIWPRLQKAGVPSPSA